MGHDVRQEETSPRDGGEQDTYRKDKKDTKIKKGTFFGLLNIFPFKKKKFHHKCLKSSNSFEQSKVYIGYNKTPLKNFIHT